MLIICGCQIPEHYVRIQQDQFIMYVGNDNHISAKAQEYASKTLADYHKNSEKFMFLEFQGEPMLSTSIVC